MVQKQEVIRTCDLPSHTSTILLTNEKYCFFFCPSLTPFIFLLCLYLFNKHALSLSQHDRLFHKIFFIINFLFLLLLFKSSPLSLSANLTPLFSVACHSFSHHTKSPDSFLCNSQLIALKHNLNVRHL